MQGIELNGMYITMTDDVINHNVPRNKMKDITEYYEDGTLWSRLHGINGFRKFEDIYVGDYFKMSRPISAYNQDSNYQLTGSQWVTIAGINTLMGNGDGSNFIDYNHLVMVPGKGEEGDFHFGRSRMNATHTTEGGYANSEMNTVTIGEAVSSGSTADNATINQQLYAEYGEHLKTTRELLSNAVDANRIGRIDSGASVGWAWYSCQAVLMSEVEVYGSIVFSSSGYDTGNANTRLPLFTFSTKAMNNRSAWYWLKDVASASSFRYCSSYGYSDCGSAGSADVFVRPRFVLS